MPEDPFVAAARQLIGDSLDAVRDCLADLPAEGLTWHPEAPESNSLAGICMHALRSLEAWLIVAGNAGQRERSRGSEFGVAVADADAFRADVASLSASCRELLAVLPEPYDGETIRQSHARRDPSLPTRVSAAWALLHCVDHLREHVGQMFLTRSLWEASAGR